MGQEPVSEAVAFENMLPDIKQRRQGPSKYSAHKEILARVREYEKADMAMQASARGDGMDRLALLDPLTELYNFRTFIKELKAELNRARRYKQFCSICLLTVDGFEDVVVQYGHLTGEAVLRVVANSLRSTLRDVDIPAKYGPQEFAIILPQTGAAGSAMVAERVRQRMGNQAITHNGQSFSVTGSIGVASYPAHAEEYDELIARSMEALQYALERGGDRVLSV